MIAAKEDRTHAASIRGISGWDRADTGHADPCGGVRKPTPKPPTDEGGGDLARSPRQVAEQLAAVYGKSLDQVAYIPALPLVSKLRLSELTGERKYADEVETIVHPSCVGRNAGPKVGERPGGAPDLRGAGAADERERSRSVGDAVSPRPTRFSIRRGNRCRSCRFTTK